MTSSFVTSDCSEPHKSTCQGSSLVIIPSGGESTNTSEVFLEVNNSIEVDSGIVLERRWRKNPRQVSHHINLEFIRPYERPRVPHHHVPTGILIAYRPAFYTLTPAPKLSGFS